MNTVRIQKEKAVSDLCDIAKQSHSMVAVHYRGMDVTSMTALRAAARKQNIYINNIKKDFLRNLWACQFLEKDFFIFLKILTQ